MEFIKNLFEKILTGVAMILFVLVSAAYTLAIIMFSGDGLYELLGFRGEAGLFTYMFTSLLVFLHVFIILFPMAFWGAYVVWGWEWYWAVLLAFPGLGLMFVAAPIVFISEAFSRLTRRY